MDEDLEPPDSVRIFVSSNGESDYVDVKGRVMNPGVLFDEIMKYDEKKRLNGSAPSDGLLRRLFGGEKIISDDEYVLYRGALEELEAERFQKGGKVVGRYVSHDG